MTNLQIQEDIRRNVEDLLKGSPEILEALAVRANETEQNVAYFRKLGDRDRVRYEMHVFLRWLKKISKEDEF